MAAVDARWLACPLLGRWATRANVRELGLAISQVLAAPLRQHSATTLRVDVRELLPELVLSTLCLGARHVSLEGPHLLLRARADAAAAEVAAWMRTLSP